MGSTFLALVNDVLGHFNEVPLTSSNFASAAGFYTEAKAAVVYATRDLQQSEKEWPFNWHRATQILSTMGSAGLVESQLYTYPVTTLSICDTIDWQSFFLVRDDTLDPTVAETKLPVKSYDEWMAFYRSKDKNISYTDTSIRVPEFVFQSQDNQVGFSPPPDRPYTVTFEWWGYEADLSAYSDTTTIPSNFNHVIKAKALSYCYLFRGDKGRAEAYDTLYKQTRLQMRQILIPQPTKLRDGRRAQSG